MKKVLALFLVFFCFAFKHPFYLSVTDLTYITGQQAFGGTIKVFTNDLEEALKRLGGKQVDLIHPQKKEEVLNILKNYFEERLKFKINDTGLKYNLLDFESEEGSLWLYIETEKCPKPKTIKIENGILYDFIGEQINIVTIELDGQKKSWKVNNPEKNIQFEF